MPSLNLTKKTRRIKNKNNCNPKGQRDEERQKHRSIRRREIYGQEVNDLAVLAGCKTAMGETEQSLICIRNPKRYSN